MVHVLPHWNWERTGNKQIPVYAYTNCEEVELFVNGKSFGKRVKGKDLTKLIVKFNRYPKDHFMSKYRLSWDVPYSPGSLRVVAYNDGKPILEKTIHTAGAPAKIRLNPDRQTIVAAQRDLSYITVRIEDGNGNLCPRASNLVRFKVTGAGSIAAVGNGNASTTEPFVANKRHAFSGMCMLIVKSGNAAGEVEIIAEADGLTTAATTLEVTNGDE
jgi:beta-galactosidase